MYIYIHILIHAHTHTHTHTYIYAIYIHTYVANLGRTFDRIETPCLKRARKTRPYCSMVRLAQSVGFRLEGLA